MAIELIQIKDGNFPKTSTIDGAGLEYIVVSKADGVTYGMTTSDFKAFLGTVQVQVPKALSPSDPAPTLAGIYIPTESGTYPDGIVVDLSDGYNQLIFDGTTWSKVVSPIDLTAYLKKDSMILVDELENQNNIFNAAASAFFFIEAIQEVLRGKTIIGLGVRIQFPGTFSVFKGTGIGTGGFTQTLIETFIISRSGRVNLYFALPVVLAEGEWLGFFNAADTSKPMYYAGSGSDGIPSGLKQPYISLTSSSTWNTSANSSLGINVIGDDNSILSLSSDVDNIDKSYSSEKLFGKKLTLLSDSIGTYTGYIPSGYASTYPRDEVDRVTYTWWAQLLERTGMVLDVNNSWTGSCVAEDGRTQTSMCNDSRLAELGNPDIVILAGGTNDYNYDVPLGDLDPDNSEDTTFVGACIKIIKYIRQQHPAARLYLATPIQRARQSSYYPIRRGGADPRFFYEFADALRFLGRAFALPVIDLDQVNITYYNSNINPEDVDQEYNLYTLDGLHPNIKGMKMIAERYVSDIMSFY